jgi:hypothetical protein
MYGKVIESAKGSRAASLQAPRGLQFPAIAESARLHEVAKASGARHVPLWFRERLLPFPGPDTGAAAAIPDRAAAPLFAAMGYEPALENGRPLAARAAASLAAVLLHETDPAQIAAAAGALKTGGVLLLECEPEPGLELGVWAGSVEQALARCGLHVVRSALVAETVTCLPDDEEPAASSAWCAVKVTLSEREL